MEARDYSQKFNHKIKKPSAKTKHRHKSTSFDGSLAQYLQEIDSIPLLTREEEEKYAKLTFEGDNKARENLIKANLRFVVNIAKKYQNRGLPLIDLINEGNMGLLTAADKFDYRKGYHFISYAVWWIKQSILKALSEKTKLIRLPLNRANQLIKIERFKKENERFDDFDSSNESISEQLEIEYQSVNDIMNASREYVSLDAPIQYEKKERFLYEVIKDSQIKEPEEIVFEDALKDAISSTLKTLSDKERQVIRLRYGLEGIAPLSLKEIGQRFNLTKERIRQIEKKAMRRLKQPSRCYSLKSFLNN